MGSGMEVPATGSAGIAGADELEAGGAGAGAGVEVSGAWTEEGMESEAATSAAGADWPNATDA
jgi:hypothetical protein